MEYKLLVLDLDGTLTNSNKEITKPNLDAVMAAQKQGVKVVLASGRPTYGVVTLAEELNLAEFGGYILSYNGGLIFDLSNDKAIYTSSLDNCFVPTLYKIAKDNGAEILTYDNEYIITETPNNKYVEYETFLNRMKCKGVDSFVDYVTFNPNKCLIVAEPTIIDSIEGIVTDTFGDKLSAFKSEEFYLEIVPTGIDKAKSLNRLLEYTGFKSEDMVAIGDGFNDLSMIKLAGLGVAMDNAQNVVKEEADYITLSNEMDGVAHAIDMFILNR